MKKNTLWGVLAISAAMLFASCAKDDSTNAPTLESRNSGVVADNPADLAKVPVVVSSDFMNNGGARTSFVDPSNRGGNGGGYQPRGPRTSTKDATPPVVNITSPLNGAAVSGSITITVDASDNVGLSSVTMAVNGSVIATWATAPFSVSWSPAADGSYTLTATAKDTKGNVSTHSIVVTKSTTTSGGGGGTTTTPPTTLPSSAMLQAPPMMSQGGEGSCVSMAVTVARNIEQYYSTNQTGAYDASANQFSPEFLYNYVKVGSGCGSGSAIVTCLGFILNKGICTWNSLPYSSLNGCDTSLISSSMKSEALNYKIQKYSSVLTSDLTAMKTSIATKHPLIIGFQYDNNFYNAYPGYIWSSRGSTLMSNHSVTIIGYDDSKRAYKVQNSWGSAWGDQGFTWIDYDFLPTISGAAYRMNQ